MGSRLNVQFARGGRERREPFFNDRPAPRTRRTIYRLNLTGLPAETSWQVRLQSSMFSESLCQIQQRNLTIDGRRHIA
jgi:hypothetical protein